jgi:hypothetical protein
MKTPIYRYLRGYSLDPGFSTRLDTAGINEVLSQVPFEDSNIEKKNGWQRPARNLFKRLVERTQNRVLQTDDDNPAECNPNANPAKAAWRRVGIKPVIDDMFIELQIQG